MEREFVILCFCILAVSIFTFIRRMVSYNNGASCGVAILFSVLLYYCIIPIIILCNTELDKNSSYVNSIQNKEMGQFLCSLILIVLFILSFLISYYHSYKNLNTQNSEKIVSKYFYKIDNLLFRFTLIVGGLSIIIYIKSFGGIEQLLFYAEYLRSFATNANDIVSYEASILVVPARLITVTPLLVLPLFFRYRKKKFFIWFLVSLFLAIIFLLVNAGRTYILSFLLMFSVPLLKKRFRHPWLIIIIMGLCSLQLLDILDSLFIYFKTDAWILKESNLTQYLNQFSYPMSNVLNASGIVDVNNGFRYGQDFVTGILNIIPGINYPSSIEPTSFFYGGSDWKITGGTPNDIITFGYLEFGLLGSVVMGILLGYVMGKTDSVLILFKGNYGIEVFKCAIIVCSFLYIVNADIISLIRNQMQTTCLFLCVAYSYFNVKN